MRYQINKTKYLNSEELSRLTGMLNRDDSRNAVLLKLALATGARANELLNLKKSDLDESNNTIFVRGLKNSNDREIPVEQALFDAVKYASQQSTTEYVFDIGYSRLVAIWNHYKPTNKSFHSLRHTTAIELYKRTKDLRLVKTLLGHVNIMNTMVYADYVYQTEELKKLLER